MRGAFLVLRAFARHVASSGGGSIVNMGPGFMWTHQVELQAAAGSQYFAPEPATVAEQMIGSVPLRRYGGLEEVPGAVAFLLGDGASYVTGINVPIVVGIL